MKFLVNRTELHQEMCGEVKSAGRKAWEDTLLTSFAKSSNSFSSYVEFGRTLVGRSGTVPECPRNLADARDDMSMERCDQTRSILFPHDIFW